MQGETFSEHKYYKLWHDGPFDRPFLDAYDPNSVPSNCNPPPYRDGYFGPIWGKGGGNMQENLLEYNVVPQPKSIDKSECDFCRVLSSE